jgi:outer membrane protein assembly factor BamE (lipoprotein component of BamABCDE complex)
MRITLLSICLLGALAISACSDVVSTHGQVLQTATIEDVRPGLATKQDIQAKLGSPTSTAAFDTSTWYYISQVRIRRSFFNPVTAQQRVLVLHFDGNDVLDRISMLDEDQSEEVTLVSRQTPTAGHKLSILEQLLGNVGRFVKKE